MMRPKVLALNIQKKHLFSLSFIILATNVCINETLLSRILPVTQLHRFDLAAFCWTCHIASAAFVALTVLFRNRICVPIEIWQILLAGLCFLSFCEAFIRLTLFTDFINLPLLEYPGFYADPFSSDDYWVLESLWSVHEHPNQNAAIDPVMGWTASSGGQLGSSGGHFRDFRDLVERPVLFFGDSFVSDLPERMESELKGFDVVNYGVGGYGADQILMRAEQESSRFGALRPIVLIGILLEDMDRSLLRYRGGQKPYFTLEHGNLTEHHPQNASNQEFVNSYRFQVRSFLFSGMLGMVRLLLHRYEGDPIHRSLVNGAIFKSKCNQFKEQHLDVTFVVFFGLPELREVNAGRKPKRLRELREILSTSCESPRIETSQVLIAESNGRLDSMYIEDGHHSDKAKQIISKSLSDYIRNRTE